MTVRLILCGVGGVGRNLVRVSRGRRGLEVVAAYSRNEMLRGRDIGELADGGPLGVVVTDRATALATPADILLVATTSFMAEVASDVEAGIEAGLDVVCTAEEMADPWDTDAELARRFDERARAAGVSVIGAGANPGYIYEVVGLALTGAVWNAEQIRVRRVVDLSGFSATVQRRLGIGFDPAEFARRVEERTIFGHIGFPHTIRTFARRFGAAVDAIEEVVEPIVAERDGLGTAVPVAAGQSIGLSQRTTGIVKGKPWFVAEFVGHVAPGAAGLTPQDSYAIDGHPDIRAAVTPGFNPQVTTAAALSNLLPLVVAAAPGLRSVTDLPIPAPWG